MSDFVRLLERARVLISVGPGGVGKTSTSAAIAMAAAGQGRRVIVLTIDPARRLANALGLPEIGNSESQVSAAAFARAGLPAPSGRMTAMMLDIKRTWDETVERHHPNAERREKLLGNRFYQALSGALAGSQEYMAMEKLHELATRTVDPLDLIVLDTPPAAHAIDFLEAPTKLMDALDNDATRWLLEPYKERGRVSTKLFDVGSSLVMRSIGRFTGAEALEALAELLASFQDMFDGFRQRARSVREILGAETTQFLIVSSPRKGPLADARDFKLRLDRDKLHTAGFLLNRATPDPFRARAADRAALDRAVAEAGGSESLAARLEAAARALHTSAEEEQALITGLRGQNRGLPVWVIPELPEDVHDLRGLDSLRRALLDGA